MAASSYRKAAARNHRRCRQFANGHDAQTEEPGSAADRRWHRNSAVVSLVPNPVHGYGPAQVGENANFSSIRTPWILGPFDSDSVKGETVE